MKCVSNKEIVNFPSKYQSIFVYTIIVSLVMFFAIIIQKLLHNFNEYEYYWSSLFDLGKFIIFAIVLIIETRLLMRIEIR